MHVELFRVILKQTILILALTRENLSSGVCEQQRRRPDHLISAFVIRLLESVISKLATSKFLSFQLVFVAEEIGLSLTFSETPKTGFVASRPIL